MPRYDAVTTTMDEALDIPRPTSAGLCTGWRTDRRKMALAIGLPLLAGLVLRVWWVFHLGLVVPDSRFYGEFARNLLEHGIYGFSRTLNGVQLTPVPTLIRLPGYPLFLAACFVLFGKDNYTAVMLVQALIDLWSCLLLGGLAARMFGARAGRAALWLAVLCPFTVNYVAIPLTETLTLFCIALAFYGLLRWREMGGGANRWVYAIGFALAYAILLRPEQGMLAAAVVPAMFWMELAARDVVRAMRPVVLVSALTLLPLLPWAARNWRTFHVFQPLAPRYANDPGVMNPFGFQRWYRTWGVDFASTDAVYWNFNGAPINIADLPNRAFDTNAQYAETEAVLAEYNKTTVQTAAIDDRFNALALERIAADPLRYYVALPVARVVNMMFRPRTDMLPVPDEWWKYQRKPAQSAFALAYAALNAAYFVLAAVGMWRGALWRDHRVLVWSMLATIALRVALLLTLDDSEPRYTLEFFPVLLVMAAPVLERLTSRRACP